MGREVRFVYYAADFDAEISFLGGTLGLERVGGWDRGPTDRGALFDANGAVIEVILAATGGPPRGVHVAIEVDDVAAEHVRLGTVKPTEVVERPWGHRDFWVRTPAGLDVVVFTKLESAAT